MSLLTTIDPEQATGEVAEMYKTMQESMGMIPNAMKMQSTNPLALKQLWESIGYIMNHESLPPQLFTFIRLAVSNDQSCAYCINLNKGMLMNAGISAEQIQAFEENPSTAPLGEKELALLLYTIKATSDSNSVGEADINALRELGASDLEIFDALNHGARQVYGDIMINALKVENDF